ncbi:histidine phosphatase family protein [Gymnodinialimonas sp. 2305UL16-5]|uniref:histidine phosphatase family protein n=1 Tax=Gymnodinialimonas mytili TaxID=3126503 RepID=UPI0030A017EC
MVRRLILVRHGPTHQQAFTGWRDVPADLSDTEAVGRMRDWLPENAPIISSDLKRAVATADAIAGGRRRLPHDPDLREFNFGDWDGVMFDQIAAEHPELSRAFWEEPGEVAPPNGESWNDVSRRASGSVATLLARHPGDLIVVAHFGAILCLMSSFTQLDPYTALGHRIDPLSATALIHGAEGWALDVVNHRP